LAGVFERARPMKVYGQSVFRPELEDVLLLTALDQAHHGYDVPWLSFVDLRELITGATSMGGIYSRPLDVAVLKERARAWRLERALYTSLSIISRLFPETTPAVEAARPTTLRRATQELLNRLVVAPVSVPGGRGVIRGADRLRRLLTGQ
jgi:hypothetical protein